MLKRLLASLAVVAFAGAMVGTDLAVTAAPAVAGWPPQCLPQPYPTPDCPQDEPIPVSTGAAETTKENLADGCTKETRSAPLLSGGQTLFTLVVTVRYCVRVDVVEVIELKNDAMMVVSDPNLTVASGSGSNRIRNNLTANVFIVSSRAFSLDGRPFLFFLQGTVTINGVGAEFSVVRN